MMFGHKPIDWDAAAVATARQLKTVQRAIEEFAFTHPEWFVEASVANYPPRVWIRAFLWAPEKTRRTTTGVNVGSTAANTNYVQALTPRDDELRVIGDMVGQLGTADFTPRRVRDADLPWVEYELRCNFEKYEVKA